MSKARFSAILALIWAVVAAPILHASAACAHADQRGLSIQIATVTGAAHAHADATDHSQSSDHHHGAPSHHHDGSCCDTSCNMACTALLPVVGDVDEPVFSHNAAVRAPLLRGFSFLPDLPPPKSRVNAAA